MIRLIILASLGLQIGVRAQAEAPKGFAREVVAAVILAESGGHGFKGMAAVYEVIHARASVRKTSCLNEAIRRKQFSCLNGISPGELINRMKGHKHWHWVHDDLLKWIPITSHTGSNPFNRCRHYHATSVLPYWAKGQKPFAVFGGHAWYNSIR